MPVPVPYSAKKDDLFFPGLNAVFFPNGRPRSDAALCAEMARLAYCELGTAKAPDRPLAFDRDKISQVLAGIGFAQCTFFEVATAPDGSGSHGLLAVDDSQHLAVLSFRGTDAKDPTDILDDMDALPKPWQGAGNVHAGFAGALLAIWNGPNGVSAALGPLVNYRLLFTGHSLGAAMATLAASLSPPQALYTFGSPRVGDQNFVARMHRVTNFRYVDCSDIVTNLPPPKLLGYQHIPGNIYYINFDRDVEVLDPADPSIIPDQIRAGADYTLKHSWVVGDVAVRPLADHAPVNYVWAVTAKTP